MNSRSVLIGSLLVALTCVNGEIHLDDGVPHTKLANGGLVAGSVRSSRGGRPFSSFIGIPYATIPERFQESQEITTPTWDGAFNATIPGAMCPQSILGSNAERIFGDEDCLNLNIYVPSTNNTDPKGLPVMVYLHGGSFLFSSGLGYEPQYFMDEDVIIVTINYRLGAFGFLSTGDSVVPGNNGMKDIVMALKWVQKNIKAFGGDPSTVTLFGESAGATAVHYVLLSPTSKGLIHRAMPQSSSALSLWAYNRNPKRTAVELATHLKCKTSAPESSGISSEEILTCLKGVSMQELIKAQFTFKPNWPLNLRLFEFVPTSEPTTPVSELTPFITQPPIASVTGNGSDFPGIPIMGGANEDEGAVLYAGVVLSNPELLQQLNSDWENTAPKAFSYEHLSKDEQAQVSQKLRKFYFGDKPISLETRAALRDIFSDSMFSHGVFKSATETRTTSPVYLYMYAKKGPLSVAGKLFRIEGEEAEKVGHGDELVHLFETGAVFPGTANAVKPNTPDEEFSKNLVRLWTSFATHGEPKHTWGNSPNNKWEPISKDGSPPKWFKITENPESEVAPKRVQERMQLWNELWSKYFAPAEMASLIQAA